jgi:hypothetical protein
MSRNSKFEIIEVLDPTQLDISSRLSGPPNDTEIWSYQLQDRGLMRARFDSPITGSSRGTSAE